VDEERGERDRAVPASDELLRLVIESSTEFAIIAVDPAGKVTSWNIGAERLLGWAADEILGRDGDVIFTPEDRAAGAPQAERCDALARGRAEDERWHLRKDGSRFWGSGLLTPLADREAGFVKIMRDRTAQRRAEEAVRASEDRFRTALQIETVGVIFFDTDGGITEANDAFLRMSGYSREEVAAGSVRWDELTPPEWMPASERAVEELKATGSTTPYEKEYFRKDGSRWWALFAAKRLSGTGGIEFVLDITERKLTEERLRESEGRFRALATGIPQLVFRSRVTGGRTWGSPQWEVFTGLSDARSRGFGWLDAVHPDDRRATLEAWGRAGEAGEYYVEHRIRRVADGEYRWHQTRAAPLRDGEGPTAEWVGTSADVHDLRGLQDRQQVLLAELQHRTRNLLAVVQATARRTMQGSASLEEFAREYESRLRALSRVQGLLARASRETLDLGALVEAELAAHGDGDAGKVRVEGPPVELPTEAVQVLALALHELATNAVKHGALSVAEGKVTIDGRMADGNKLVVVWHEQGGPLTSAPTTTGFGMTLLTRAIRHQHKGDVELEWHPEGLRCRITLPVAAGDGQLPS
jgi:PAS domain S-box-containing protein